MARLVHGFAVGLMILAGLVCASAVGLEAKGKHEQTYPQTLTTCERAQIGWVKERGRTNSREAAEIIKAYEANQANAKALQDEFQKILDAACRAHGLEPAECDLTPDDSQITKKAPALPAAPTKTKATPAAPGAAPAPPAAGQGKQNP